MQHDESNNDRATRPMWTSPEYEKAIADAMAAAAKAAAAQRSKPRRFHWPSFGLSPRAVAWTIAAIIGLAIAGWVVAAALDAINNIPPRDPVGTERRP
jgi:hypothetical protein